MSLLDRDHLENNLLNRIEKLAADIEQLERFVPSPVGEIPDNIAYFQPVTGDLNAPGDINVIGNVRVEGFLNLGTATELTIASGAVTATRSYHTIDTESDGASDDLDTISGGIEGYILVIRAVNDARTVVAKDATGNLQLSGDITLDNSQDTLTLIFDGTHWLELMHSDNGA